MRKVTVSFLLNADTDDQATRITDALIRQARTAYLPYVVEPVPARPSEFTVESVEEFTPEPTEEPINA